MKRSLIWCFAITTVIVLVIASFTSGAGEEGFAVSGAPGDLGDCSVCHIDFPVNSGDGLLSITGTSVYEKGKTYLFVIKVQGSDVNRYGFQALMLNAISNENIGSWNNTGETRVVSLNSRLYVESELSKSSGEWVISWTAPNSNSEVAQLYISAVAAENPTSELGDYVYTLQKTVSPDNLTIHADFQSDREFGCSPLTVRFFDNSTGNIDSWLWKFSDNTTSTRQNPVKTFNNPGSYDVTLTAKSGLEQDTEIKNDYISVLAPIKVNAGPDVSLCRGDSIIIGPDNDDITGFPDFKFDWVPGNGIKDPTKQKIKLSPAFSTCYTLIVEDANLCTATDIICVNIIDKPDLFLDYKEVVCLEDTMDLHASTSNPNLSYEWMPDSFLSETNQAKTKFFAIMEGVFKYTLNGTASNGCVVSRKIRVKVSDPGHFTLHQEDTTVCLENPFQVKAEGAELYKWEPDQGLSSTEGNLVMVSALSPTVYTVTGMDSSGTCVSSDSFKVNTKKSPSILILFEETDACPGINVQLGALPDTLGYFSWTPSVGLNCVTCPNPVSTWDSSICYQIEFTDPKGCHDRDTMCINKLPEPEIEVSVSDSIICPFDTLELVAQGSGDFSWSPEVEGGLIETTGPLVRAAPIFDVVYTVQINDLNGCTAKDSIAVNVFPIPEASLFTDKDILCPEDSTFLLASGGLSYYWPQLSVEDSLVWVYPDVSTLYKVEATDSNGCKAKAEIDIFVYDEPVKPVINIDKDSLYVDDIYQEYFWAYEGAEIPGANEFYLLADTSGYYNVRVSSGNGCSTVSDSVLLLLNNIDSYSILQGIKAWPNPTYDKLFLQLPNGNYEVQVLGSDGKPVHVSVSMQGAAIKDQKIYILELGNLPAGNYWVYLCSPDWDRSIGIAVIKGN